MAEEVVCTYLRNKLSSILQEAEEDSNSPLHIVWRFRSIERLINFKCDQSTTHRSSSSSSIIPVDLLYDLIDALSECRNLAHQRRRRKTAASKKGFFFFFFLFFYFFRVDPLSEFFFKRKMRKRLADIEKKLKNTTGSSPAQATSTGSRRSPSERVIQQTYPILDPSLIIGFESQAEKIEGLLLMNANNSTKRLEKEEEEKEEADDNQQGFAAIGIVGGCGCGKTALAQKVFASPRIQEEFSPRIWVCLSNMLFDDNQRRVDPRVRVVNYILEEIGHDVYELENYADDDLRVVVNKLLEKLQRGLMGKRYLIVLDDVWRVDEWYADLGYKLPRGYATGEFFSHGLPKGSGGAVIVTSRRENVIRRIVGDNSNHVIRMEPHLSNEICWRIFSDVVRQQGKIQLDHHPMLNELKDDIIRKCDGLPLGAKILGNIISQLIN